MCAPGETNLLTFSVEQPLYVKWLALRISAQSIISKVRIINVHDLTFIIAISF